MYVTDYKVELVAQRTMAFDDLRRSAARNAIRSGVPEQVVMDLGGWRPRSVLARYNATSERDLTDAFERVTRYVAERSAETPKVEPLRAEPAQSALDGGATGEASGCNYTESRVAARGVEPRT
jgi:hypothetical protein